MAEQYREGVGVDEGDTARTAARAVMEIAEAAALLGVSEQSVRRWIDANEPDADSPDRVPVAERVRGEDGQPVSGRWRRPFRDAVVAEARRRGRVVHEQPGA